MSRFISGISKSSRVLGFFGLVMALAAMFASAPAAPAAASGPEFAATSGKLAVNAFNSSSGDLVKDAKILVYNVNGTLVAQGNTNANGEYVTALYAGQYKVFVNAVGFKESVQTVTITSNNRTTLKSALQPAGTFAILSTASASDDITLAPVASTGKLSISVVFPPSNRDTIATVVVYTEDGQVVAKGETSASGTFNTALTEGQYKVVASAQGYQDTSESVTVQGGNSAATRVTLKFVR